MDKKQKKQNKNNALNNKQSVNKKFACSEKVYAGTFTVTVSADGDVCSQINRHMYVNICVDVRKHISIATHSCPSSHMAIKTVILIHHSLSMQSFAQNHTNKCFCMYMYVCTF